MMQVPYTLLYMAVFTMINSQLL